MASIAKAVLHILTLSPLKQSLHTNEVWDLVKLPKDRKTVGLSGLLMEQSKDTRLETQVGYSQRYYDETFSPVVISENCCSTCRTAVASNGCPS